MKGGRTAPRNWRLNFLLPNPQARFNEGGADCPPKHRTAAGECRASWSFNEGGADCPPKPQGKVKDSNSIPRFNEGGADCPPKPSRFR